MRGVAGVRPQSRQHAITSSTWLAAAIAGLLLALVVIAALHRSRAPEIQLQPTRPEPSQTSNSEKKAAREAVRQEARLTPPAQAPATPAPTRPAPARPGASAGTPPPENGRASWYELGGDTASGEDMAGDGLTAAHPTLPLGARVRVENLDNGRAVVVRINDRGPSAKDRIIDVSKAAAEQLGMIAAGVATVRISLVSPAQAAEAKR
jgi:rare lipoprotein A